MKRGGSNLFASAAPSEGVRNVTVDVTNSTAVQLSWLPPPTPASNGQVVNYTISESTAAILLCIVLSNNIVTGVMY